MITKDINGNVLINYDAYISADTRDFTVRILANGTLLDCAIKRMTITKGSCATQENFSIGNVIASTLNLELLEVSTSLEGKMLEVQVGLYTTAYVYITVGMFKAIDVKQTAYSTSVVAYGHTMASMAGSFVQPNIPSLLNIINAISTATGVQIIASNIDDTKVLATNLPEGCSCYQALQIIASVVGGYVTDTYDGKVEINKFSSVSTVSVTSGRMLNLPNVSETDFTITGVEVKTGQYSYSLTTDTVVNPNKTYYTRSGTGTDQDPYVYTEVDEPDATQLSTYYERHDVTYSYGSPIVLSMDNPYMSADLFDTYKAIVGYAYRYGEIDLSLGDPRIEGTDVLSVTDVNGSTYIVPCHQVTHIYDGGWQTQVTASRPTSEGDGMPSTEPISQRIDNIAQSASLAQGYAEQARESAESAIRDAERANEKANEVEVLAVQASEDANEARLSADTANVATNMAMYQLGVVENIVGVLDMVQKNGVYIPTPDTEVQPNKWYFTREGSGTTQDPYVYRVVNNPSSVYHLTDDVAIDSNKTYYTRSGSGTEQDPYVYTEVGNPVVADIGTYYEKYYELSGIDSTIQNYVSSHLVLTESGLSLRTDQSAYRIDIAPTGIMILDGNGMPVAEYGETAIIGSQTGFNVRIGENANNESEIGFYSGSLKIAYMNGSELYVTNSLSFGHFSFIERANGHFTLKLIRGD